MASSPWWRHHMETFSTLLAICTGNSPVTGESPQQRPVTRNIGVFFDLRLNKWLSKQLWGWWFETPSCPLWRHSNTMPCLLHVFITTLRKWSMVYCDTRLQYENWDWTHHFSIKYVIMGAIASQITSLTIVYSTVYSGADQRKHQSSASLAFVRGIHRGPVNSPHKWPVTRKMFPFDDVIMGWKDGACR